MPGSPDPIAHLSQSEDVSAVLSRLPPQPQLQHSVLEWYVYPYHSTPQCSPTLIPCRLQVCDAARPCRVRGSPPPHRRHVRPSSGSAGRRGTQPAPHFVRQSRLVSRKRMVQDVPGRTGGGVSRQIQSRARVAGIVAAARKARQAAPPASAALFRSKSRRPHALPPPHSHPPLVQSYSPCSPATAATKTGAAWTSQS